ncbi:MAG: hypothetical protein ABR913_02530 [Sedimentisphaerales bacterium]|jgi:hypothetical protein
MRRRNESDDFDANAQDEYSPFVFPGIDPHVLKSIELNVVKKVDKGCFALRAGLSRFWHFD